MDKLTEAIEFSDRIENFIEKDCRTILMVHIVTLSHEVKRLNDLLNERTAQKG